MQGPAGADGATGPAANICGAWVPGQNYNKSDAVFFNDLMYVATTTIMSPWSQPDSNPEWLLVSIVGPQGVQGIQGIPGNDGPPGPPLSSPLPGNIDVQGRGFVQLDLALYANDPNGSGETAVSLRHDESSGASILAIASRRSGADLSNIKLDVAGMIDGAGNPSVQHGDGFQYDGMNDAVKPVRHLSVRFSDLGPLNMIVSDPPTQQQMQIIANRQDELLSRLQQW